MDKEETWQSASISTFEIARKSPYLDRDLSLPNNQQSYNDRLKSGYEEGLKNAEQELNEYRKSLERIFESLLNPLKEVDKDIIQALANLAISISKQIIRRELQINSEQVVSLVKEAIKLLPLEKSHLIIHLNPRDINIVRNVFNKDEIAESYSLVEDPSIEAGGCKVATEDSIIDATIDSQVAQIAANIFGSQRTRDRFDD